MADILDAEALASCVPALAAACVALIFAAEGMFGLVLALVAISGAFVRAAYWIEREIPL